MQKYNFYGPTFGTIDRVNGLFVKPENTLVINGFWRSGTTWLQECIAEALQAKSIFEPFQARAKYIFKCLPEISPSRRDYAFHNGLMPYAAEALEPDTQLFHLINQAQRGQLTQKFVLRNQKLNLERCLNQQVVVKYTRGALILRAIANTFSCPVIHVYRDPRAVIASIKKSKPNWGEGAFNNFSLSSHLLEIDDGRYDYFSQWKDEISDIEKTNDYGRIAAYYCLTERYLADSFANGHQNQFALIRYEDLIETGLPMLLDTLHQLDIQVQNPHIKAFVKPSSTQYANKQTHLTRADRLSRWRTRLSQDEAHIIESVVTTFGMQSYLASEQVKSS
ncbi:MAG: sulfotransferase domain-containing protein [Thainema sp.]